MACARSKMARTSGTVVPSLALLAAFRMAWYSISVGITCATTTPTHASTTATNSRPMNEMPRWRRRSDWISLIPSFLSLKNGGRSAAQWNEPMRPRLPKFIQMKKALPTTFWSGTKPQ